MSSPQLRRADRAMSEQRAYAMLERGFSGRLATVGEDGYPYCIPLLYIWMDGEIYVHTGSARGHLRANVEREPRICFELDEPDQVFDYGRFECDSGLAYQSVIVFGKIRIVEEQGGQATLLRGADGKIRQAGYHAAQRLFPAHRRDHGLRHYGRANDGQGDGVTAAVRAMACERQNQNAERAPVTN